MRIGCHLPIGGGLVAMAQLATNLGCGTAQIFSRSPRGGKARQLEPAEISGMQRVLTEGDCRPLVVHMPYFVNLAMPEGEKLEYCLSVLVEDLERAEALGAPYLVAHVGHWGEGEDEKEALRRSARSLLEVISRARSGVTLLLENTAGMGRELGSRFEHLAELIELSGVSDRLGVCLDLCHAFAAGHNLSSREGVEETIRNFDWALGLYRLRLVHCNDSKEALGSHRDRHANIGLGTIGLQGFRALLEQEALRGVPWILETPVDSPGDFAKDLTVVRDLISENGVKA